MKITVLCPHFAPDTAPTGQVITQLVEELSQEGHRIHVVTSLPWYRTHSVEEDWKKRLFSKEKTDWGRITRIHPCASTSRTNLIARSAGFVAFSLMAALFSIFTRKADLILAMSPPLTLAPAGWIAAKRHRAPLVLNLSLIHISEPTRPY